MKKTVYSLIFALALVTAYAVSQTGGGMSNPQAPTPPSATTPDASQQTPGTNPPGTDQTSSEAQKQADAEKQKMKAGDQALQTKVHDQLGTDPAFSKVEVSVKKGEVKLTGTVASDDERKRAVKMAEAIPGVHKVKDKLKVNPSATTGSKSNAPASAGAASTTPSAGGETASTTSSSTSAAAEPSSSSASAGSAPSQAGSTSSTALSTGVGSTSSSQVGASGSSSATSPNAPSTGVGSTGSATTGSSASGSTTPAEGSTSSLPQSSGLPQSDTGASASAESSSLKTQIDAALKKEPTLANSNVNVVVNDSTVELSGSVATGKEKQTAKRIAQSFAGNRRVVDRITVTGHASSSDMSNPSSTGTPDQNKTTTPRSTTPQTQGDQSTTPKL